MKIRQAKKILLSKHWIYKFRPLRQPYINEKGEKVYPSWHDIPNPTWQKARRVYFRYYRKQSN